MLEQLREEVCAANCRLPAMGLVSHTWGNVSAIDRESGLVVIKPSGVEYDELTPEKMVIVDLDGRVAEGTLRPSSDTRTHLELYKAFAGVGGIVHTHCSYATAWAPAGRAIPADGPAPAALTQQPCRGGCAAAMAPLRGAKMRNRRCITPRCWRRWPVWRC